MRKYLFPVMYGAVLALFTAYLLLDTFAIRRVYSPVEESYSSPVTGSADSTGSESSEPGDGLPGSDSEAGSAGAGATVTDRSYSDGNIEIKIDEYTVSGTAVYVADIALSDARYLKTALAGNVYGRNVKDKTSSMANEHGAILAVNGDFYGSREDGCVLRGGVLYRGGSGRDREDLAVYSDGSLRVFNERDTDCSALAEEGVTQVFSFGPSLVVGGEVTVGEGYEVGKAMASNPRTAIGVVSPLHYVFVVSDGRTSESRGLSLYQLAEFMRGLGVKTAYNLDGGGSSTMYFNGEIVNRPTTNGHISEREVSDIVYVGY